MKDKANAPLDSHLRQKAEEFLQKKSINSAKNYSDFEILKLVHELEVHQIELEMQNEELNSAKIKAETEAEKYTNLYDFAPSGYLTLSKNGEIIELNFRAATLLHKERSLLQNKRFALFASDETRPTFNLFLEEIFESKTRQTCEIMLSTNSEIPTFVNLIGIVDEDNKQCVLTMHDVSQRKKAEEETKIGEEKYRTLFETNRDSITIFRLDNENKPGNFIEVNPATTSLFGYSKQELLAMNIRDIEIVSDKKRKLRIASLISNGRIDFETIIKNKKGNHRLIEIETIVINYLNAPAIMNITRDITERKQNEENTKKAQENLASILEAIPDLLFEVDLQGKIHYYQGNRNDLLYVPESEFIDKNFREIIPIEATNVCFEAMQEALHKGWSSGKQYSLDLPQGKCWFELSVSPIKGTENHNPHFILISRDITERNKAEEKLRVEQKRISKILELVGNPIFLKDNEHRITFANTAFCTLFGQDEKNIIGKTLAEKVPENEQEHFLRIDRKVLDTGVTDIREETLTVQGEKHTIITSKTRFLDTAGNKSLIGSIYDITDRKNAEEALQKSQEKLQGIFNVANSGIVLINKSGKFLLFNDWCCKLLGYTRSEFQELNTTLISHPDDLANSKALNKKIIEGKIDTYLIEKRYLRKDKSFVWCEISASAIKDNDNNVVNIIGIINDITERKRVELAFKNEKQRLDVILTGTGAGTWEWDIQTGATIFNEKWAELLGYTLNELAPISFATWQKLMHPDDSKYTEEIVEKHIQGKLDYYESTYRMKHKNGNWIWILGRGKINKWDRDGKPLLMSGTHLDVTERKLAEEKLIASESLLKQTQTISNIGSYSLDLITGEWTSTAVLDKIFGIDSHFEKTKEGWQKILHPDWRKIINDYMIDEVIAKKRNFNKEYKIITFDSQEERWVHGIGEISLNNEGVPIRLIGSIQDITARKIAEDTLRESEEKYRSLVENSPDGVIIYVDDKIAFINEEGVRMLRAKDKNELIGKPVLQFVHPDSLEDLSKRMKEIVTDNYISTSVEAKFIRIDGIPFDVEVKGIPTLYERKNAVQIIVHDITLRKQNTLELNKINRVYALISQINNLILRTHNRQELFQEICNIAVNFGKFHMSWIGLLNDNDKIITAAFAGHEDGYFTKSNITTVLDVPEGRGPTGKALREGRTVICNDIANDPMMKPWRKDALERGYSSVISIPIIVRNTKIGAFNLYSQETNFFSSEEEISLLEKIILNIAFALESILVEEDRKHTEEKIRQLSQAVEQSPVTIVISNTNGDIEYVNSKFIETTGYQLEEVIGKNPRVLKSGYTSPREYKGLWQTIAAGNEWHGEFHNKKKDGTLFWESATISPILNAEGKITHYIAIKEDITHRKRVEKELVKSKERAEESDRLKLVFLANMSHEIRTPMNGILGFTELLKEPKLTGKEQQEYISIIEKSGKRMLNIINDIISISKVESGQIEISLTETNVNEQLKYIQTFFQPEAKQKGIQLTILKKLSSKDNLIKTDREKVYAVLTNLVKNALKFTTEGSIEFGCEKKGGYLEFFVKDTGLGISKSQKKIIFERFRQANETISRTHEGSGLGLAISKAYVEMLDGKIWVESQERKGSAFYFTIPFHSQIIDEVNTALEKAPTIPKEENKVKDLKVLIVEDDAISKLLITIAVKPYSKEILKVSTGIEAIEACKNNPDIDLVMMDINMPEMDGYEATKNIREFNKDLIIIAQTANGMQSDRDNAIAAGCTDYISKPINITDLGTLIQKYFN